MPKRKQPPAGAPAGIVCATCGREKPASAFRGLAAGTRQDVCRACRPPLPEPAWKTREFAESARRQGAIREAAVRRAEKEHAAAAAGLLPAPIEAAPAPEGEGS